MLATSLASVLALLTATLACPGEDGHDHGHSSGEAHGTRRDYVIGFVLSVILTAIPFGLVMSGVIADPRITAGICMAFALVQIVVHVVCFLHLDTRSEGGWTLLAFLFTAVIVVLKMVYGLDGQAR